jgi:hypothetical protein
MTKCGNGRAESFEKRFLRRRMGNIEKNRMQPEEDFDIIMESKGLVV